MGSEVLQTPQRPRDLEAEKCVLGSILRDPRCATEVAARLCPEDFYLPRHAELFRILLTLDQRSAGSCDPVTVAHEIDRSGRGEELGGRAYLEELMLSVPSLAFLDNHLKIVRDLSLRRGLLDAAEEIERRAVGSNVEIRQLLNDAEQAVFKVGDRLVEGQLSSASKLVKQSLEQILGEGSHQQGLKTGFIDLDEKQGFRRGDLVVLAARPSMGKTALALNIIERVVIAQQQEAQPGSVLLFSLEMPAEQIILRMMACLAKVRHDAVRKGHLDPTDKKRLVMCCDQLSRAALYIDDSSQPSLAEMRAKARRVNRDQRLALIVVDYLQLLSARAESRQQEISLISRNLKSMARDLEVPVLALAQLNRKAEDRSDHRPMLSDLRESGAIEQDADLVMLLYRESYYDKETENKGIAELIIAKNRNGPTDDLKLHFTKELMRFENAMVDSGI